MLVLLSGTGKKGEGVCVCVWGGGAACTGGYKGVRAVRPESVAGGGEGSCVVTLCSISPVVISALQMCR